LPFGASVASALRALNEGVISPTVRVGVPALELAAPVLAGAELAAELELLVLELQAATSSAALRLAATRPALFIWPALFVREDTNVPRFSLPPPSGHGGSRAWRPRESVRLAIGDQLVGGIVRSAAPKRPLK
jgi:hypothetical protein